jgi:cytochrome c
VSQIRWAAEPGTPVAKASADRTSGPLPLTVQFSSAGSSDPEGGPLSYQWDFDANGTTDSVAANASHTYTTPGDHAARLTVTDNQGKSAVAGVTVTAGNTIPTVSFSTPPDGAFYSFGDRIAYRAVVTDPEDAPVDCSRVTVRISMGHSTHFHPMATANGCEGVVQTESAGGHGPDDNLFAVLEATYTDNGAPGARALTGSAIYTLHPKHKQAEYSSEQSGVSVGPTTDPAGGSQDIVGIGDGDHFAFAPVSLFNINRLSARVDAAGTAGRIEVRAGSPSGRLVGTIPVAAGGWQTASANVCDPGGSSSLFLIFRGFNGSARVNWLEFGGGGVTFGGPSTLAPCGSGTPGPGGTTTDPGTSTVGKLRGFLMNKRMSLRSLRRNGLKLRVTLPRTARALKVALFRVKGSRWRTPKRPAMSRTFKYKRGGAKRVTWRFTRRQKQRLERGRWVVQVQAGPSARRLQAPKLRKRLTVVR